MRHFIFDVWIWTKDQKSRPVKSLRMECETFPLDQDCWRFMKTDEEIFRYLKEGYDVMFNNLREYQL